MNPWVSLAFSDVIWCVAIWLHFTNARKWEQRAILAMENTNQFASLLIEKLEPGMSETVLRGIARGEPMYLDYVLPILEKHYGGRFGKT